jgi:hypothetical protein
MGLFAKFKAGLAKTQSKLVQEIKRIVTRSPRLTAASIEELEAALIAADLGMAMTEQIISVVKKSYETQGSAGLDFLTIAQAEIEKSLSASQPGLKKIAGATTVVSNDDQRQARSLYSVPKADCAAGRLRHLSCGGNRAVKAVGRAPEGGGHRRRLRRGRRVSRSRCRHSRPSPQGGLSFHRHCGPPAYQA